jgi:hypothetical protein
VAASFGEAGRAERTGDPAIGGEAAHRGGGWRCTGAVAGLGATVWQIGLAVTLSLLSSKEQIVAMVW